MELLFCIMLMLLAVLIANILGKFFPMIATPIVQIGLGVLLSFLPISHELEIDHEMFLFLFVAPLAYYGGMEINRKALWKLKGSVANMAILLVILSGILVGGLIHILIPAVSLLAAFVLMASLGPTDHIAVDNVERHSHVPERLMEMLKGESVLGEVTSVVLFSTGLSVFTAGHFDAGETIFEFLWHLIGGILVGFVLSILKMAVVRWLCACGINAQTVHSLLGIMFPIAVFLVAEELSVGGVVAIFIAGIISNFDYKKENPEVARLTMSSHNIWALLSFSLDGMVFVYLGMEIPELVKELFSDHFAVSAGWVIAVILMVGFALFLIRFLWGLLTLPKAVCNDPEEPVARWKAALIFSMSGARGAITMATVATIPVTLSNGETFPQRELLLVIAMGVIIFSVLVSYIVLPILAPKKQHGETGEPTDEVYHAILQEVIDKLRRDATLQNNLETELVVQNYLDRQKELRVHQNPQAYQEEKALEEEILRWKSENVKVLVENGTMTQHAANYFLLTFRQNHNRQHQSAMAAEIRRFFLRVRLASHHQSHQDTEISKVFLQVLQSNTAVVLEQLRARQLEHASAVCGEAIQKYERLMSQMMTVSPDTEADFKPIEKDVLEDLTRRSLLIERDTVQKFYEQGILPYGVAHSMKKNITLVELQMD